METQARAKRNDGHVHKWSKPALDEYGRVCELCGWFVPLNPNELASKRSTIRELAYWGNL